MRRLSLSAIWQRYLARDAARRRELRDMLQRQARDERAVREHERRCGECGS